jgi:hypothetical protein
MAVKEVAEFVPHHETQFAGIEAFQQAGREHDEQAAFLRLHASRVEAGTGVYIDFDRDGDAQTPRAVVSHSADFRCHFLAQTHRSRQQSPTHARRPLFGLSFQLFLDPFDVGVAGELVEQFDIAARAYFFGGKHARCCVAAGG